MLLLAHGIVIDGTKGIVQPQGSPLWCPIGSTATDRLCARYASGQPVPYQGPDGAVSAVMTVRPNLECIGAVVTPPAFQKTGAAKPLEGGGIFEFSIAPSDTSRLIPGLWYWDAWLIGLSGTGSRDQVIAASAFTLLSALAIS